MERIGCIRRASGRCDDVPTTKRIAVSARSAASASTNTEARGAAPVSMGARIGRMERIGRMAIIDVGRVTKVIIGADHVLMLRA